MNQAPVSLLHRRFICSRVAMLSLAAGLATGLMGCDRADDDFERTVSEARDAMLVLTAGGSWPAPEETRGPKLEGIIRDLNEAMGSVEGDAQAPAQLMIARATAGQGEISMSRASGLAAQISLDLTRADAIAREYSSNRWFASTLVGPDASVAAREIEAQIGGIDSEIRELQSRRQSLAQELDGVQNEIAQLLESARAERLEEADLRDQSLDAEPMRRAELIAEAVKRSREAESYERSAAEKELTAGSLAKAIEQVEAIIEDQQGLREINSRGLERITQIDTEISSRRRSRERVTQETLDQYSAAIDGAAAMYRSEFLGAIEEAVDRFGRAASTARQARSMGDLASAAAGEHASAQARAHELHAQIAARLAASAAYLTAVEEVAASAGYPATEGINRFSSLAEQFAADAERARAAAADAYDEASSGFSGAGSVGQVLSERYQQRSAELRGEAPAEPTEGQDDFGGSGNDGGDEGAGVEEGEAGFGDSGADTDGNG